METGERLTEWVSKEEAAVRHKVGTKTIESYRNYGFWPDGRPFNWRKDGNKVLIEVEKGTNWEEEIQKREKKIRELSENYQKALQEAVEARRLENELEEVQAELARNQAKMDEKARKHQEEVTRLNRDIEARNNLLQKYKDSPWERAKKLFGFKSDLDMIPDKAESLNEK